MGYEVETIYIANWVELKEAATKTPLCDIDTASFWKQGTAQLTSASGRWFDEFLDECYSVSNLCPPKLEQQLMTLFAWKDHVEEFHAPFSRSLRCADSSPWAQIVEGMIGAFNPQSVAALCEASHSFSWDECEPFFGQGKKDSWLSFKAFRTYGQRWIDHYNEAYELNSGLVIYYWG